MVVAVTTELYHPGEIEVQRLAGVEQEAGRVGRIVARTVPPAAARLLASQRLAVAASLDERGRPWASLLTGGAGFIRAVDETLLFLGGRSFPEDPLWANLRCRPEVALLVIDLEARRRLRFSGKGLLRAEGGLFLAVDRAYGNCPKYIQARRLDGDIREEIVPSRPSRSSRLNDAQRRLISGADTFFIASFHPEGGADASHRGGRPGFVRLEGDSLLSFPDYPGNNMFNTLGNLVVYPTAGLLFVDFESGDLLQLTGRGGLVRDRKRIASHQGARGVLVEFTIHEVVHAPAGCPLRWTLLEPAPDNP